MQAEPKRKYTGMVHTKLTMQAIIKFSYCIRPEFSALM